MHGQEDVRALEVAVPHVQAMHVLHRGEQLVHEAADLAGGELPAELVEVPSSAVLHHEVHIDA